MPESLFHVGAQVQGYRVLEPLGAGGMGEVFRVEDASGVVRALKVLRPEMAEVEELRQRFLTECRVQSKLDHPNVVRALETLEVGGTVALVMEFVQGPTLRQEMRAAMARNEKLPLPFVHDVFGQVLAGVGHAHGHAIVHRDLKPSNVVIQRTPAGAPVARVLDFGIAKVLESEETILNLTRTGAVVGTLTYMSPEQIQASKDVTLRSDLFSLGVILYELVTGVNPFRGDSEFEIMSRITRGRFEPPERLRPDLPQALSSAIAMALRTDPAARFVSCEEFAAALSGSGAPPVRRSRPSAAHDREATTAERPSKRLVAAEAGGCATHPKAAAGWQCTSCQKLLCPDCAAPGAGPDDAPRCALCAAEAAPLRKPAPPASLGEQVVAGLAFPHTAGWWAWLLFVGVMGPTLGALGAAGTVAWLAVLALLFLHLVREHAESTTPAATPALEAVFGSQLTALARLLLGAGVAWVPVALSLLVPSPAPWRAPAILVFLTGGVAYLPAIAALAVGDLPPTELVNPAAVFRRVRAAGAGYWRTVAACAVLFSIAGALQWTAERWGLDLPVGALLAMGVLEAYLVLAAGGIAGRLGFVCWRELGLPAPAGASMLVLPGVAPRGTLPAAKPPGAPSSSEALVVALRNAVAAKNAPEMLRLYKSRDSSLALPALLHYQAGCAATACSDFPVAVEALRRAGAEGDPTVAARAMLALGRLYSEQLGEPQSAVDVLTRLVERFSGSPEANEALQRFAKIVPRRAP